MLQSNISGCQLCYSHAKRQVFILAFNVYKYIDTSLPCDITPITLPSLRYHFTCLTLYYTILLLTPHRKQYASPYVVICSVQYIDAVTSGYYD